MLTSPLRPLASAATFHVLSADNMPSSTYTQQTAGKLATQFPSFGWLQALSGLFLEQLRPLVWHYSMSRRSQTESRCPTPLAHPLFPGRKSRASVL